MLKKMFKIRITEIIEVSYNNIKREAFKNKSSDINDFEKIIQKIREDESTTMYKIPNTNVVIPELNNSFYYSNFSNTLQNDYSSISQSTMYSSNINIKNDDSTISVINVNYFNPIRSKFFLKYKLYDISLIEDCIYCNHPPIYKINNEYSAYLYPNEIITYSLTVSGFLFKNNMIIESTEQKIKNCDFNPIYGIYFCKKIIEIKTENGSESKLCAPNNFLCSECMEINKKRYKIKNNYLININGRIAKINRGKYHCFGHFLCGNQIEDCITNFSCKACKLLNYYSQNYT